jgi:hypothetical protein
MGVGPGKMVHPTRRTATSTRLAARTELAVVSRTLGHADLSTTADIYAHLTPAMLERSAARMDAILARRDEAASSQRGYGHEKSPSVGVADGHFIDQCGGRGGAIRTLDLLNPIQVRYQAAPRPDGTSVPDVIVASSA